MGKSNKKVIEAIATCVAASMVLTTPAVDSTIHKEPAYHVTAADEIKKRLADEAKKGPSFRKDDGMDK